MDKGNRKLKRFREHQLTKKGRRDLFLILMAPVHFWAILMFFLNFPKSEVRLWTAIGLFSYDVVIAFVDSSLLFLLVYIIGYGLPAQWKEERRILFLGNLGFTIVLGLIFAQYLDSSPLKPGQMWSLVGLMSFLFLVFFEYFSLTRTEIGAAHLELFYRSKILAYLYLGLDVFGLVIILLRNIFWVRMI